MTTGPYCTRRTLYRLRCRTEPLMQSLRTSMSTSEANLRNARDAQRIRLAFSRCACGAGRPRPTVVMLYVFSVRLSSRRPSARRIVASVGFVGSSSACS
eukprot:11171897-Lingulodinium_polyedra.AAC.1